MSFISAIPQAYTNVQVYNAKGDGVSDDTSAINAAISAASGGAVFLPIGTYMISSPLSLSTTRTYLIGAGANTVIKATSGFTGSSMVAITADKCGLHDLQIFGGTNTTSSTNPVAVGISVSAARYARISEVRFYYVNGWAVESIGGASINNVGTMLHDLHVEHCSQGLHFKGVSGSNYVGQGFMTNIHVEAIDSGDAIFFEDINDMECSNINGAVTGGSTAGSMLHIKGNCNSIFLSNIDLGALAQSTVSPCCLIETSSNGSPSNIVVSGGVIQKGSTGISITDGSNIFFKGVTVKSSNGDGVVVSGSTVATPIAFDGCVFQANNQAGGTAYDLDLTHSTGFSYIRNCHFLSPVAASTAGSVTNPANDSNHHGYFFSDHFSGSNTTPSTVFTSSGTPQIVRGCPGYNPRGSITPTTIGSSPFTGNSSQNDISLIFTAINGMTAFTIGGTSVFPVVNVPYRIPARQSFTITWATTAPTYIWLAD